MKKTTWLVIATFIVITLTLIKCKGKDKKPGSVEPEGTGAVQTVTPVPLPTNIVPGFNFPEDSNIIYSWLQPNYDSAKVYQHAWGVWAGLTAESGQSYGGDKLLVYQTWFGIGELQTLSIAGKTDEASMESKEGMTLLTPPTQIKHAVSLKKAAMKPSGVVDTSAGFNFGSSFWVAVAYDPNAAKFTLKNKLIRDSTEISNRYKIAGGIGNIPAFPSNAITTKPVYYVGRKKDSLIRIATWPGEPSKPMAFGPPFTGDAGITVWNTFVYADVKNQQPAGKQLVPVVGSNPTTAQIAAATCNLSDFINFKIDARMAAYLNKQQAVVQGDSAHAGDIALLVAMHVTTKEISNWTWQTYYWDYNPAAPKAPSSSLAQSNKPSQLSPAAAHYSVSTAYLFVTPNQPLTGGTNKGVNAMIGYNPYLEAGFAPSTFQFKNQMNPDFKYGIQTNCMSCHALAGNESIDKSGNPFYSTDQYIDNNDRYFVNKVKLDFAWSLQAAIASYPSAKPK
jgi:hypothetical protein